jgi:hypothetical protein
VEEKREIKYRALHPNFTQNRGRLHPQGEKGSSTVVSIQLPEAKPKSVAKSSGL